MENTEVKRNTFDSFTLVHLKNISPNISFRGKLTKPAPHYCLLLVHLLTQDNFRRYISILFANVVHVGMS